MVHIEEDIQALLDSMHFLSTTDTFLGAPGAGLFDDFRTVLGNAMNSEDQTGLGGTTAIDSLFSGWMTGAVNQPTDWASFVSQLRSGLSSTFPAGDPLTLAGGIVTGPIEAFRGLNGMGTSATSNNLNRWSALNGAITGTGAEFARDVFIANFNHFIEDYEFGIGLASFTSDFTEYLFSNTGIGTYDGTEFANTIGGTAVPDLVGYEEIYDAYFPGAPAGDFNSEVVAFYNEQVAENGYFLPLHSESDWFERVRTKYIADTPGLAAAISANTGSDQVQIIFEVYQLITDMLGVLQRVATVQAARLTFYANEQKAYTDLIGKIPKTSADFIDNIGLQGDSQTNAVGGLNTINQSFTEKLRSYRSIVSDESKQHQTSVNQTNEIVNQQASLSTEILQKLSTMLQSIFK